MNASAWPGPVVEPEWERCENSTAAWLWLTSLQPAFLALVGALGLLGNGLVLCVFCLQRAPCSVADIYLGNLAAADLLMMGCLPFWAATIARGYRWAFGEVLCKLVNVSISINYMCSISFLTLVSLDRYLALVKPMSPCRLRRAGWAKRVCAGVWLLGPALSLPTLLFRRVRFVEDAGVDACILDFPHAAWRLYDNLLKNVLGFLLPLVVVTYCTRHMAAALSEGRAPPGLGTERKSTRLVLAVLAVFLVCWTPHQVMRFLDSLDYFLVRPGCLWGDVLDIGIQLSTYLAYSNSAINPFLFVIVGTHFRRRTKDVFQKLLRPWSKDGSFPALSFTSVNRLNDARRISRDELEKFAVNAAALVTKPCGRPIGQEDKMEDGNT